MIGLTALLNLVEVVAKVASQTVEAKGNLCQLPSSPPTIEHREVTHLGVRLPAANHRRLMGLLSQRVERQLLNSEATGKDGHECASHRCRRER